MKLWRLVKFPLNRPLGPFSCDVRLLSVWLFVFSLKTLFPVDCLSFYIFFEFGVFIFLKKIFAQQSKSDKNGISFRYESVQSGGPIPGISSGLRQSVCSQRHPQLNKATTTESSPGYRFLEQDGVAPWTKDPMRLHNFTLP